MGSMCLAAKRNFHTRAHAKVKVRVLLLKNGGLGH